MKITYSSILAEIGVDKIPNILKNGGKIKFVIVDTGEKIVRLLADGNEFHSNVVRDLMKENSNAEFIGGGKFGKQLKPEWGSVSCLNEFGRDRPEISIEEILSELNTKLELLFATK